MQHENSSTSTFISLATIAHRGSPFLAYENTYDAFIEAGKRNHIAIETDIHFTQDQVIVCHHNHELWNMEKKIWECTYEEIKDAPLYKDQTAHLCLFKDYLSICKKYHKIPVIEWKTVPTLEQCKQAFKEIEIYYGDINQVCFISFLRDALLLLKKLKEELGYMYSIYRLSITMQDVEEAIEDHLPIDHAFKELTLSMIEKMKEAHLDIIVWTCDEVKYIPLLQEMGVKAVTTNCLECCSSNLKMHL